MFFVSKRNINTKSYSAFEEVFGLVPKSANENLPKNEAKVIEPAAKTSFLPDSYFRALEDYYKEDD